MDNALASQAFTPLAGMEPDEGTARLITVVVLLLQAVLAVASTRLVGLINTAAVGLEVALVVVMAIALTVAVLVTGDGATGNLTRPHQARRSEDVAGPKAAR